MSKSIKIYIAFLMILLGAIIYLDATKPKPINWNPTYSLSDKIPLGMYVFDKEINGILKNQKIEKVIVSPYEYFYNKYDNDTLINNYKVKGTFLSISEFNEIDDQSIAEICNFVSHGNSAFISSKIIPNSLLDSLKLKINSEYKIKDTVLTYFANKNLGTQKYKFAANVGDNYFSKIDTLYTTVLGYQKSDTTRINFIKVPWVQGNFYLHLQPAAFTNYYLLNNTHTANYAQNILSYIPKGDVFWHIKNQDGANISNSPLRFILSKPALAWAYYLAIVALLIFIVFNAKRKQRTVPIINPLRNTTIDFTKTIGNLYYQEGNHDNIINKKIIYFLEKIRNEYLLDTTILNDDFVKKLQQKSGKNLVDIQKVVFLINAYRRSPNTSIEEDLLNINSVIDKIAI